ncbi:MAG: hypothetical protein AAGF75_07725 [Cyanobacteria bacterium P01_H01_bin.130]
MPNNMPRDVLFFFDFGDRDLKVTVETEMGIVQLFKSIHGDQRYTNKTVKSPLDKPLESWATSRVQCLTNRLKNKINRAFKSHWKPPQATDW